LNGDRRFRKPLLYPFELQGLNLARLIMEGLSAAASSFGKPFAGRPRRAPSP
jgi:hypothetical protein